MHRARRHPPSVYMRRASYGTLLVDRGEDQDGFDTGASQSTGHILNSADALISLAGVVLTSFGYPYSA